MGSIAADELYDGPFCILSIVDNRTYKRLTYHVLRGAPKATDVEAFFRRFQAALAARGLTVRGITTDGSALYPEPIVAVFGDVPHQVCSFHVLREVVNAVLSAVAQERKRLTATAPKLPRGRPGANAARRAARRKKRIEGKVGELFAHRHLFVRRQLAPSERRTLLRITRGLPQLRTLRALMGDVYRLFDRRCRTATALAKLAALRVRLRRFSRLREVLKSCSLRAWRRRWCSWTSGCWVRRRTPWSEGTGDIARCRRRCTGCARGGRSRADWRWTSNGNVRATAARRPHGPYTRRGRHEAVGPISTLQSPFFPTFWPDDGGCGAQETSQGVRARSHVTAISPTRAAYRLRRLRGSR